MIRVFLICLVCCCSSLMPLKQSESILSEDHTQVVERKSKNNYYAEGRYDVKYSLNVLCSDVYWTNFYNELSSSDNQSMVLLGGTTSISYYQFLNTNTTWTASSSIVDSCYFYKADNNGLNQLNHNDYYFTNITLRSFHYLGELLFYLHFDYHYGNINNYVEFVYCFINSVPYSGGIIYGNFTGGSPVNVESVFSFPKSGCAFSINAESTLDYDTGYTQGYDAGYNFGYDNRQAEVDTQVYDEGYNAGHQDGYAEGIAYSQEQSSTALTIFTGILEVGLLPVNVFLQMFNYEVFGINIAGFISGLITIAMVMIFVRFIFGGKDNGK